MSHLDASPLQEPGPFRWFHTASGGYSEMLRAIERAERSVRLEMYTFAESAIGQAFRAALIAAAQRRVQVRVLVDAVGSLDLSDDFWEPLRREGGEVRWFNGFNLRRYLIRDHRKLLVCDERVAFVGGYNIAQEYEGDGVARGWRDCGAAVSGALVPELAAAFDAMFGIANLQHKRFAHLRRARMQTTLSLQEAEILLMGPGWGRNPLKRALLGDLKTAHHIKILSAYFVPTRSVQRALIRCARRGARVQIVLAGKTDVPLAQLASRRFYHSFLKAGIELHEYLPQVLHAKVIVADDVVYVGSANLDRRSLLINYEVVLRIPSPTLASEVRAMIDRDLAHSQKLSFRAWRASRSAWEKLKERWAFFLLARVDPFLARQQLRNLP